jgi:molecular chaperone GrpE (heat shock protein)
MLPEIKITVASFLPALSHTSPVHWNAQEAIVAYYGEVFAKVDAILDSYGMTVVPSLGSPFDYNIHEAIQQVIQTTTGW